MFVVFSASDVLRLVIILLFGIALRTENKASFSNAAPADRRTNICLAFEWLICDAKPEKLIIRAPLECDDHLREDC